MFDINIVRGGLRGEGEDHRRGVGGGEKVRRERDGLGRTVPPCPFEPREKKDVNTGKEKFLSEEETQDEDARRTKQNEKEEKP